MRSRKKNFCFASALLLALVVPMSAIADPSSTEPPTAPAGVRPANRGAAANNASNADAPSATDTGTYVSLKEAPSLFKNFTWTKEGSEPNSKVTLYGMIYDDCVQYFEITNTGFDPSVVASNGTVGFQITDPTGEGRKCVKEHKGASCSQVACDRLSQTFEGATMSLMSMPDADIGILFNDPNADRDGMKADVLPNIESHKSAATLRAQAMNAAAERRKNTLAKYRKEAQVCRNNEADLTIARDARESLSMLGVDSDELEKIDKALDQAELNVLDKESKTDAIDDLDDLRERLKAYSDSHPESVERAALIYYQIAHRYTDTDKPTADSFNQAIDVINEAKTLEGLSKASKTRLDGYIDEIKIGQVKLVAQQGISGNMALQQDYNGLMTDLLHQVARSCSLGDGADMAACANAQKEYNSALTTIPQAARQAEMVNQMAARGTFPQMPGGTTSTTYTGTGFAGIGAQGMAATMGGVVPASGMPAMVPGLTAGTSAGGLPMGYGATPYGGSLAGMPTYAGGLR